MRSIRCLLFAVVLAGSLAPAAPAADPEVAALVETLEKNARDPFEQGPRESAIRKLGKIGTVEAARALLPLFEDPFAHLADHAAGTFIAMAKGDGGAEVRDWLGSEALRHRLPAVRAAAAAALGFAREPDAVPAVAGALGREKDPSVLVALARTASFLPADPDLDGLLRGSLGSKDGAVALAAAEALARREVRDAVPDLVRALAHRDPLGRAGAVAALQRLDAFPAEAVAAVLDDEAEAPPMALAETLWLDTTVLPWAGAGRDALVRLLRAPSWRVRAAAIEGALRVWRPEIVDLLVDRLAAEEGRLRDDARTALETFTGQALGDDPDLWKSWWAANREEFRAARRPRLNEADRVPRSRGASEEGGSVAFFDLPVCSRRVIFLFDLSGSMRDPVRREEEQTKMELLVSQFERTLAALPPDTSFDLLVYRYPSTYPPKPALTRSFGSLKPATKAAVRKAADWLRKQEPKGWGAFYEPLVAALGEDVDTVVLLSDGRPSRGRYDRDFRILAEFPRENRFRFLAVNTVLIGQVGADREFMEKLAELTGGRFREAGR